MPKRAIRPSPSTLLLSEFFADREGLTGTARDRFLRFLRESLGFRDSVRAGHWRLMLVGTLLIGMAGFVVVILPDSSRSTWHLAAWTGCMLIGVVLAFCLRRAEHRRREPDRETHWRVYCHLLRPVVLAEQPGLLDRNLADDHSAAEQIEVSFMSSLWAMLIEGSPDLWWSALAGLWTGMIGLLVAGLFGVSSGWILALPAPGVVIGPLVWVVWQCGAYWLARREPGHRWPR